MSPQPLPTRTGLPSSPRPTLPSTPTSPKANTTTPTPSSSTTTLIPTSDLIFINATIPLSPTGATEARGRG
ncbi:predicted protein [Plenodomus lingam JN3]|uniref:Uncharacterized protein n=1 Tax=Leptosphaeria maculans (strain JN3 / isolate v23.1.3 / race Av1-4-5-6-7-8) TaxID=985895 RepID=E5A6D4_LEPMJ|nr:predicted protein [Plenodomus lingam JN3]CBX99179.1 predicted protein [Plenodomus lingam JN3]